MKTRLKYFKNSEEIDKFFQDKVRMNSSTSDEVEATLDQLGLRHSHLYTNMKLSTPISPLISHSFSFKYKYSISCSLPARPTMLIFANKWMVHFRFTDEKLLAEIEAAKVSDGI